MFLRVFRLSLFFFLTVDAPRHYFPHPARRRRANHPIYLTYTPRQRFNTVGGGANCAFKNKTETDWETGGPVFIIARLNFARDLSILNKRWKNDVDVVVAMLTVRWFSLLLVFSGCMGLGWWRKLLTTSGEFFFYFFK